MEEDSKQGKEAKKKWRKKSVGGRGYLAQRENFQVKFSVNSMFLRYDIIMLTSFIDSEM